MRSFAAVCALAVTAPALSACAAGHHVAANGSQAVGADPAPPAGTDITAGSSYRLVLGGRVVCTATVTQPIQPGSKIPLTISLHNVSGSAVRASVAEGSMWFVVKAGDGTTYDTRTALRDEDPVGGPHRPPVTIVAGATKTLPTPRVLVHWSGQLQITPGCEGKRLPDVFAQVAKRGAPPDDETAIP